MCEGGGWKPYSGHYVQVVTQCVRGEDGNHTVDTMDGHSVCEGGWKPYSGHYGQVLTKPYSGHYGQVVTQCVRGEGGNHTVATMTGEGESCIIYVCM